MTKEIPTEAGPCELAQLRARVKELEGNIQIMEVFDQQKIARIRELEEALPDPEALRFVADVCGDERWKSCALRLVGMADRIEKVMKGRE